MTIFSKSEIVVPRRAYESGKIFLLKPMADPLKYLPFTRSGVGMRRKADGYMEEAATGVPRLHFPVGGGCPRWLFEDVCTNLVQYSNDVNNAYWNKTNVTAVPASGTSPSGSNDAVLIYPTTTGNNRTVDKGVAISSGVSHVTYCIVKASGMNWFRHFAVNATDGNDAIWVNLSTGAVGTVGANVTAYGTINFGNGYWLVWAAQVSTGTTGNIYSGPVDADASATATTNGTDGVLWWLNMIHEGTYPSAPIITAGATATRATELCGTSTATVALADFTIIFMEMTALKINNTMIAGSNTSGGANSYIYLTSANVFIKTSTGAETNVGGHGMSVNTQYNIAIKRTGSSIKFFRNGVLIFTQTLDAGTFDLASVFTAKDNGGTSTPIFGEFGPVIIVDQALTDQEIIDQTA